MPGPRYAYEVGCLCPAKTKNVENFIFAELLKCTVDRINHIHKYFVNTNAVETIARVGGVSPPSNNEKGLKKFIFAELLKCTVDCINHIYMYFQKTIAVEAIARVGGVSPPSKNKKC